MLVARVGELWVGVDTELGVVVGEQLLSAVDEELDGLLGDCAVRQGQATRHLQDMMP